GHRAAADARVGRYADRHSAGPGALAPPTRRAVDGAGHSGGDLCAALQHLLRRSARHHRRRVSGLLLLAVLAARLRARRPALGLLPHAEAALRAAGAAHLDRGGDLPVLTPTADYRRTENREPRARFRGCSD